MHISGHKILSALLFVFMILPMSLTAGERIYLPDDVFYHRFASYAPSAEAVWINPAWLPASRNIYVQYIGEYENGELSNDKGFVLAGDRIGIAWRNIDSFLGEDYSEYTFAGGMPMMRDFYLGISYRYINKGPGLYHKRHFWNAGLVITKNKDFRIAAVFSNLNRGKIDGERSELEQLYSFTYFTPSRTLILSTEITMTGSQSFSDAEFRFGAEYILSNGMRLYGMIDEDKFMQLGFRLELDKIVSGFQSRFDDETDHTGTSIYGGVKYTQAGR